MGRYTRTGAAASALGWLLIMGSCPPAVAQTEPSRPWSFFAGFTSHARSGPGFHLGSEYALAATPRFMSLLAASLHMHSVPDTETGYGLQARWGQRYTAGFGLTLESHFGLGIQYTRWVTTVFEFRDSMGVPKDQHRSGFGLTPQFVVGIGYDFERVLRLPLHVYARPGLGFLYPDLNDVLHVSLIAELGVRWTPGR